VLVTALLVKNEADKYLERVLRRCLEFSSKVIVLDDGSTDGSDRIAWRLGCEVKPWTGKTMWGTESPARAALWDWGAREAGDGWLLICDADMELHGDPRPLTLSSQCNAWAWPLWDLWDDEKTYRCDGFWQGHEVPRPWFFKPSLLECDPPIWPDRGIHTGHCPQNAKLRICVPPYGLVFWKHYAYLEQPNRVRKYQQYLEKRHLLTPFELAHATSVGD
jgi:hypothetical protein